jgi:hypothetical protein
VALDVKERFETYEGELSKEEGGDLTRIFNVQGEEVATAAGAANAIDADDIPSTGHKITVTEDGDAYTYYLKRKRWKRVTRESVDVSCFYSCDGAHSSESPDDSSSDNQEAEERRRGITYGCPYNESLDFDTIEVEQLWGKRNGKYVPLPQPVQARIPTAVWKFDVNICPDSSTSQGQAILNSLGGINDASYPPVSGLGDHRPFYFSETRLMYIGCTGQPLKIAGVNDISDETRGWVWKMTLEFAFNPDGWEYEFFYLTRKQQNIKFETDDTLYLFNYDTQEFEEWTDSSENAITKMPAQAELPLVHRGPGDVPIPSYWAQIPTRPRHDFADEFDFYWGALGT